MTDYFIPLRQLAEDVCEVGLQYYTPEGKVKRSGYLRRIEPWCQDTGLTQSARPHVPRGFTPSRPVSHGP